MVARVRHPIYVIPRDLVSFNRGSGMWETIFEFGLRSQARVRSHTPNYFAVSSVRAVLHYARNTVGFACHLSNASVILSIEG